MSEVTTALMDGATAIIVALIGTIVAYAISALREMSKRIKDVRAREFVDEAINRVDDLAGKIVTRIEQTVAQKLREDVRDGVKDKSELAALGEAACEEIFDSLNDDYKAAIEDAIGNVAAYIADTVETKVYELKQCAETVLIGSEVV